MSWSYSGDPSSSPLDQVRFLLGDTDHDDPASLSNEEITWLISEWDNLYFAAAAGAEQIAAQYAKEAPYSSDAVSVDLTVLQQHYTDLAETLRKEWTRKGRVALPYDGSNRHRDWRERVERIKIGMHDVREAGANAEPKHYCNPLTDDNAYGGVAEG